MDVTYDNSKYIASFDVGAYDAELGDKLAFIYLVKMKFDGEEVFAGVSANKEFKSLLVHLQFNDFTVLSNVKALCQRNLDGEGRVKSDYKGALDAADPGRRGSGALKERAKMNRLL